MQNNAIFFLLVFHCTESTGVQLSFSKKNSQMWTFSLRLQGCVGDTLLVILGGEDKV